MDCFHYGEVKLQGFRLILLKVAGDHVVVA